MFRFLRNGPIRMNLSSNEGTQHLYQALIAKYNGIFEGFEKDIPTSGKAVIGGGEFNFRPELNAIKERLELLIATDKAPFFPYMRTKTPFGSSCGARGHLTCFILENMVNYESKADQMVTDACFFSARGCASVD